MILLVLHNVKLQGDKKLTIIQILIRFIMAHIIYNIPAQNGYHVSQIKSRIAIITSDKLGDYAKLYENIFAIKCMLQYSLGFKLIWVRLYKDMWNGALAAFHIKEHLVILILVRLSIMIDNKATSITRSDGKWKEGIRIFKNGFLP